MLSKIKNFSNYLIEDTGKVFSISKKDYLTLYENNYGYNFVSMKDDDGNWKCLYVHRLIAEAFLENLNDYPIVMHLDDNPKNNDVKNLKWGTQSENINFCVLHNRSPRKNKYIKNPIKWTLKCPNGKIYTTNNLKDFCLEHSLDPGAMGKVLKGLQGRTQHKGWTRA